MLAVDGAAVSIGGNGLAILELVAAVAGLDLGSSEG